MVVLAGSLSAQIGKIECSWCIASDTPATSLLHRILNHTKKARKFGYEAQ